MVYGLVLGKFYPLHKGHLGLVRFAASQCDVLFVLLCASDKEIIAGEIRLNWLNETFTDKNYGKAKIKPVLFNYSESELPNTSVSSRSVAKIWASKIKKLFNKIDVVFTSEKYGDYLAEFLSCKHISFDNVREQFPISASDIRKNPFKYWDYIAQAARPYFVKKVAILGTESTGKSILTQKLAAHFKTTFVSEAGREVVPETEKCTITNLYEIAELHAQRIIEKLKYADKILFIDTDINITRSYAQFLFNHELKVEPWVLEANHADIYLYLEADAPFIQDGTRLNVLKRNRLDKLHKIMLEKSNVKFESIVGDWQERFVKAIELIETKFEV